MTSRSSRPTAAAARLAAVAAAVVAMGALAGCEQRPEPHPAYEAPPPPAPAPLAGAPDAAPTAMAPQSPPGGPPDGSPGSDMAPAPSAAPAEGAPPSVPDQGLVAMAPIPNPEDGGPAPHRPGTRPVSRARPYGAAAYPPLHRVHRRLHHRGPAQAMARPPAATPPHPASPPVAKPHPAPAAHAPAPTPTPRKPAPHATSGKAAVTHHERRTSRAELRQAAKGGANTTTASNTTANTTTGGSRTEALRTALSAALARGATLTAPKAAGDQAAEATLVVPAGFYDTLKQEAGRQAMGDAAASANLDATLTGDGYAIIPAGAQAQPLRAGQPTTFHWTVTAAAGAKGPLRADVSAELLGGGSQVLSLGAVDARGQGGAPKWWGAALLALVVALGLGWLARTRGADARIAASRRRAKRPDGTVNGARPLDMDPRDRPDPR